MTNIELLEEEIKKLKLRLKENHTALLGLCRENNDFYTLRGIRTGLGIAIDNLEKTLKNLKS